MCLQQPLASRFTTTQKVLPNKPFFDIFSSGFWTCNANRLFRWRELIGYKLRNVLACRSARIVGRQYIRCIMYINHNLLSSVLGLEIRTKCIGTLRVVLSSALLFYVLESYQMCVEQYNRSIFHMNGETRAWSLQALTTTTQRRPFGRGQLSRGHWVLYMYVYTPKSIIGHSRILLGHGILLLMISTVHSSFLR